MLSNLDNPRGTDRHLIGHAFSEPAGLIKGMGLSDACAKSIESTDPLPAELRNFQLRNSHDRCEGAPALFGGCSMSGDVPGSSPIQGGLLAPYPIIQAMLRGLMARGGSFGIPGRTSLQGLDASSSN